MAEAYGALHAGSRDGVGEVVALMMRGSKTGVVLICVGPAGRPRGMEFNAEE